MPSPSHDEPDLSGLEQRLMARIEDDRGPLAWLQSRGRLPRVALVVALFALEALFFWQFLLRHDLAAHPPLRTALALGGSTLILVAAAWISLRPLYLPEARRATALLVAAAIALPILLALLPEVPTARAAPTTEQQVRWAYLCFADGAVVALLVFALARLLDRGGRSGLGGVAAAAAGGMAGVFMLHAHCPLNFPAHLFFGHATVPAALVLVATLAARLRRQPA
jgi:hypothetical protein